MDKPSFVCGTRAVTRKPNGYYVVCATCGEGSGLYYSTHAKAVHIAVSMSAKPCMHCGAK